MRTAEQDDIRNLCLFAHFSAYNQVAPYVVRYLREIRACDFDIVFISTSAVSETDLSVLRSVCRDVLVRPNEGFDFGSWALGYAYYGQRVTGDLLLANDSVYGPIGNLADALQRLRRVPADVRGMVESLEHGRHLQSWFLLLSPKAHHSRVFINIMSQDFAHLTKDDVIAKGEIALSVSLRAAGFKSAALFGLAHREMDGEIVRYNPSHAVWKELIEFYGVPFVKIELLRDNPMSLSNLHEWRKIIMSRSPDLVPMIERHLSMSGRQPQNAASGGGLRRYIKWEAFIRRDVHFDLAGSVAVRQLNAICYSWVQRLYIIRRRFLGSGRQ